MKPKPTANDLDIKLCRALLHGSVYGGGGMVYDGKGKLIMSTTEMIDAVKRFALHGIAVTRADAGGSPTWIAKQMT